MEQLKPFKTYAEQVKHLRSVHGLIITDEERAISFLSKVNYYRLSAYGISLREPGNKERYKPGTTFEDLASLYSFDAGLRAFLFLPITEIEIQFRSKVAYRLGEQYGPEGYRDSSNFISKINQKTNKTRHQEFLDKLDEEIKRQENLPCVKHHNDVYGGHFPIWAAIELLSFGSVVSLFSIMFPADQNAIAKEFSTDSYHLHSWLLALVEIRNICAHANRIYNMPLKQSPKLYTEHAKYGNTNKLFPVILVMKRMLDGQLIWNTFARSLNMMINSNRRVELVCLGFPEKWKDILAVPEE